uniref:Uncharacterized protein n=1 Tax=Anguilla anguilla TaxID=7936 RepID=A0A0E9UU74_ANGAN
MFFLCVYNILRSYVAKYWQKMAGSNATEVVILTSVSLCKRGSGL